MSGDPADELLSCAAVFIHAHFFNPRRKIIILITTISFL